MIFMMACLPVGIFGMFCKLEAFLQMLSSWVWPLKGNRVASLILESKFGCVGTCYCSKSSPKMINKIWKKWLEINFGKEGMSCIEESDLHKLLGHTLTWNCFTFFVAWFLSYDNTFDFSTRCGCTGISMVGWWFPSVGRWLGPFCKDLLAQASPSFHFPVQVACDHWPDDWDECKFPLISF